MSSWSAPPIRQPEARKAHPARLDTSAALTSGPASGSGFFTPFPKRASSGTSRGWTDLPCAPILFDMVQNGRKIKALAQPTKTAFLFVLNRETGQPIWPIEERPVPQSTVPGEKTSPTQPFPTRPAPFDRQGVSIDDL